MIRNLNKVYIHSHINMRNINLITVGDKRQDVVRMALFKPRWLQIFSPVFDV
jgi:hypothetical protein